MKSIRQRQILYDIAYMWDLKKKWYKGNYLKDRNTDMENKLIVIKKERKERGGG